MIIQNIVTIFKNKIDKLKITDKEEITPRIANDPTSRGVIGEGVNLGGSSEVTKNTRSKKVHFFAFHSV